MSQTRLMDYKVFMELFTCHGMRKLLHRPSMRVIAHMIVSYFHAGIGHMFHFMK